MRGWKRVGKGLGKEKRPLKNMGFFLLSVSYPLEVFLGLI